MPKITQIKALEILDSRGNPTLEVIICAEKYGAKASVPSGASTGIYEAWELRDNNKKRYQGKGVLKAIKNIANIIAPKLKGMDVFEQKKIDQTLIKLDGTKNKSKLGANAILGVSLAVCRLGAKIKNQPLYEYINKNFQFSTPSYFNKRIKSPLPPFIKGGKFPCPMFNVINGGKHADSGLDIQEFMVVPIGIKKYSEQLRAGVEIFCSLKGILQKRSFQTSVGDEGGFAPRLKNSEEVFKILMEAIKKAGYQAGKEIFIAIDAAASEFYEKGSYFLENKKRTAGEMMEIYKNWLKKYPLISIEDGLAEDDWDGWRMLNKRLTPTPNTQHLKPLIVGDDLFVTNIERLKKGIALGVANAILIKPNQIGTLTETIDCIKLAQRNNYKIIISHRSGETKDSFISDLAVACEADFIKAGAPNRGERVIKYNRLLEMEKGI